MAQATIESLLDNSNIHYGLISHPIRYSAQQTAASAHIRGKDMLKTVMVKLDGRLAMAVVPAPARVDLSRLAEITGAKQVQLALEGEFSHLFPDCERGAMPPFGNLYGMQVYFDRAVEADDVVTFNAGSHSKLIQMKYADLKMFVQPIIASFVC